MDAQPYIEQLRCRSCFGYENCNDSDMLTTIISIEDAAMRINDCELYYWLGVAYRNYCAWNIRGDERKAFLEKSVQYYKFALMRSSEIPFKNNGQFDALDKVSIISGLCDLLVNQKLVRDYHTAEPLLEEVMTGADDYEPIMCSYAQLLYAEQRYIEALEITKRMKDFISKSKNWKCNPPRISKIEEKIRRKL